MTPYLRLSGSDGTTESIYSEGRQEMYPSYKGPDGLSSRHRFFPGGTLDDTLSPTVRVGSPSLPIHKETQKHTGHYSPLVSTPPDLDLISH